jgi:hypothetical protein
MVSGIVEEECTIRDGGQERGYPVGECAAVEQGVILGPGTGG